MFLFCRHWQKCTYPSRKDHFECHQEGSNSSSCRISFRPQSCTCKARAAAFAVARPSICNALCECSQCCTPSQSRRGQCDRGGSAIWRVTLGCKFCICELLGCQRRKGDALGQCHRVVDALQIPQSRRFRETPKSNN